MYILVSLLLMAWIFGLVMDIGGGSIHTVLVLAVVLFLFTMLSQRRVA